MRKRSIVSVMLLVALGGYSSWKGDSRQVKGPTAASAPALSVSQQASTAHSFNLIPTAAVPDQTGDFDRHFGALKSLPAVYVPSFVHESTALPTDPSEARAVAVEDLHEKVLYVSGGEGGQTALYNVLYTDRAIFTAGTLVRQLRPVDYLKEVLFDATAKGVAFNPRSRFMTKDFGFTSYMYKTGMAELIGFLEAAPHPENKPYHELALDAADSGEHYQVLYYWMKSFRTPRDGDDWKQAELAKVKAYYDLDFPGSRERARSELRWFIDNHGSSPEREALLQSFI